MRLKRLCTAASILVCLAAPVHAAQPGQTAKRSAKAAEKPAAKLAPNTEATAPYDNDLRRLAEILGSLQYLRGICGAKEGQRWRDQMQALLDAEAPDGERRRRIVASFNRGYRGFQQTYRTCTPAADLVIRRYLNEGSKIARDVTSRYAN
jgi:uncharacterized protein (TIGR02301 family)